VLAIFLVLSIAAIGLLAVFVRSRGKRSSRDGSQRQMKPDKFDTTLGEFRDMREALRPLEHTRAASRRDP
jgi:hypothetical protein